jgi:HEPN domain-containing protein
MNVEKQVAYWLNSAEEDWEVACQLLETGKIRHGLFFLHLSIEKVLKAIYSKRLAQVPPKIHNLEALLKRVEIPFTSEQMEKVQIINTFNLEGRYPDTNPPVPKSAELAQYKKDSEEIYSWLIKQL